MKIAIHHNGKYGSVSYDEDGKDVLVSHENSTVRDIVYNYLTTKREFDMPTDSDPNLVGGYYSIEAKPVDNKYLLDMAMTEMHFNTGVHVDWGHEGNKPYLSNKYELDPNGGEQGEV